jgi:hypothetical protein
VLGFPAGVPKLPLNLPLLKSCDICGVFYGAHALREPEQTERRSPDYWTGFKMAALSRVFLACIRWNRHRTPCDWLLAKPLESWS